MLGTDGCLDGDAALIGILDGIANQVVEYLTDAEGIGTVVGLRTADAIELQMQFQSFLTAQDLHLSGTLAEHVGRREIYWVQLHQSVFQLVIIEQGGNELGEMGGRTLDAVEAGDALRVVDIILHQVDEARDAGSRSLDIVGDGEEQAFALVHDAPDFLVGLFEILAVDAFFLGIAVDVIDEDDGGCDGYDGKQTYLPEQILACLHRLVDCLLHRLAFALVDIVELLGGAQGEAGIGYLQVSHLAVDGLVVIVRRLLLLAVNLFQDIGYVSGYVDRGREGIGDCLVAVAPDAERFGMLLSEGIGKTAEEALAGFHHLYGGVLCHMSLGCLGMHDNGIFATVEAVHLLVQIVVG